ncbi:MAG: SsrA-binding protein [Flavobacteriaceae bacterium]
MRKKFFRGLAKVNKLLLPSLTKKGVDITNASKFQLVLLGWRWYVTQRALD